MAISDLNSDGKRDLAIAEDDPNTVSVLLNRGNGTFKPRVDFATGRGPVAVAVGDLNDDRRTDMVTANAKANTVSVLVNTPGLCTVQNVRASFLPAAGRRITSAGCRVGNVTRGYSKAVERGRVIFQSPERRHRAAGRSQGEPPRQPWAEALGAQIGCAAQGSKPTASRTVRARLGRALTFFARCERAKNGGERHESLQAGRS